MIDYFQKAFLILLPEEGCNLDTDSRDRGNWTSGQIGVGECLGTKFGVDTATYQDIKNNIPGLPETVADLTQDQASTIYKFEYWDKVCGDSLPPVVALVTFDYAVNSGIKRASIALQQALDVTVDGSIGKETLSAVAQADAMYIANKILDERLNFMQSLGYEWQIYGNGWTNRINNLKEQIKTFEEE